MNKYVDFLKSQGRRVNLEELAKEFNVSTSTVERQLRTDLDDGGSIVRFKEESGDVSYILAPIIPCGAKYIRLNNRYFKKPEEGRTWLETESDSYIESLDTLQNVF